MKIIGIDPGVNGGIAWYDTDTKMTYAEPMPETNNDIKELLDEIKVGGAMCYMEHVGSGRPGQAVGAMTTFARHCGVLEGLLIGLGIPFVEVMPQTWMKAFSTTCVKKKTDTKSKWKNKLKAEAQRLNPHIKVTLKTSDALLICRYAAKEEMYAG